jgi:hypothetical protein
MEGKAKKIAKPYLSLRRMAILSLVFSGGFHVLYMLAFFFGESLFVGFEKSPSEQRYVSQRMSPSLSSDTLQIDENQEFGLVHQKAPRGFGDMKENPKKFRFDKMLVHIFLSFVLVFVLFLYNRKMMGIDFLKKWHEIFFVILGSTLITTVLSISFSYLVLALGPHKFVPPFLFSIIRDYLVRDYFLMAVVIMSCYLMRALYRQRMIAVENEELKTENIRTHYEALKSQLDPHFLFNSMNTLQSLIEIDAEKATDYVQQLSSVLRYTLQNKEVVALADEMNCVEAYCSMMQIRYGDNLEFDFQIDKKYNKAKVLPLSVQGLVENAIKHNVISAKQPLVIQIVTTENGQLEISNAIQPKIKEEEDSGIGLANLADRYRLQWNKEVEIRDDGKYFRVTIPLIEKQ